MKLNNLSKAVKITILSLSLSFICKSSIADNSATGMGADQLDTFDNGQGPNDLDNENPNHHYDDYKDNQDNQDNQQNQLKRVAFAILSSSAANINLRRHHDNNSKNTPKHNETHRSSTTKSHTTTHAHSHTTSHSTHTTGNGTSSYHTDTNTNSSYSSNTSSSSKGSSSSISWG